MRINRRKFLAGLGASAAIITCRRRALAALQDDPLYAIEFPNYPPSLISLGAGSASHGIAPGFGYLWVSRVSAAALMKVDPATGSATAITTSAPLGNEVRGVSVGPTYGAVSNLDPNYVNAGGVDIFDPTGAIICTIPGLIGPYGHCWGTSGALYVADGNSGTGYAKKYTFSGSPLTATLVWSTALSAARPMFPAIDGMGGVWFPCFWQGSDGYYHVDVLDCATGAITSPYHALTYPYEAFRDGEDQRMLVTENGNNSVLCYPDVGSPSRVSLPVGCGVAGICRIPGGNIIACMSNLAALAVISPTLAYTANINVGTHPSKVTINQRTSGSPDLDIWNVNSAPSSSLQRTPV